MATTKTWQVTIVETLRKTIMVEAATREDAQDAVESAWHDGDYVLDADDFSDVEFYTEEATDDAEEIAETRAEFARESKASRIARLYPNATWEAVDKDKCADCERFCSKHRFLYRVFDEYGLIAVLTSNDFGYVPVCERED